MRAEGRGEGETEEEMPARRARVRPVARQILLEEQVIHDSGTGLTIQIEKRRDGRTAVHLNGGPIDGTRTFTFSENGLFESSESSREGTPPSWNREVC